MGDFGAGFGDANVSGLWWCWRCKSGQSGGRIGDAKVVNFSGEIANVDVGRLVEVLEMQERIGCGIGDAKTGRVL